MTTQQTPQKTIQTIRVMHVIDKLSVSGSGVHGITKAIEWWIPRFDADRFQFTVCSLRSPEPAGEVLANQGIKVFFLSKGKFDPSTLTSLMALVKRERVDVLHLHGYGATNFGRLVSLLTGIPNIVHEHVVFANQPLYQTVADTLLSPLTTKALAVSEPVRAFMHDVRKEREKTLETLIIGIPLAEFQAPEPSEVKNTRDRLGLSYQEQIVCTVGRLDIQKGQAYLLKAASAILKSCPNTRFLIVGDGPALLNYQAIADQEGITEKVIFTGLRRDVPALLALSDVVAIPSIFEGGPLTLLEAMNLNKPVVGTPVGFMGELISEGETGFLAPCKDSQLLAEKIVFLLQNPEVAKGMGIKGGEACKQYDISQSVNRLADIYAELAIGTDSVVHVHL